MRDDLLRLLLDFVTCGVAAKEIGINQVTLWRWIKAGKIQTYRIGREVLIEREVVARLKRERAR